MSKKNDARSIFFWHALCPNFFPDFVLTLEADNYGLKPPIFLDRSYLFKILSNLRFSFSSFCVFLTFSAQSSWRPIVKTLNLKVWTLPFTLFVIDMHQNWSVSLFQRNLTTFTFMPSPHSYDGFYWEAVMYSVHALLLKRYNWMVGRKSPGDPIL